MAKSAYCKGGVKRLTQEIDFTPSVPRNPIVFGATPTDFTVSLTEQEFTELLSAVLAGADAIYPEKSQQVVWYLMQWVEYPIP